MVFVFGKDLVGYDSYMNWIIDRISASEEAVYLSKPGLTITRKISVPGAVKACLASGKLLIWASTGYLWEVDPASGHRKRRAFEKTLGEPTTSVTEPLPVS